MFDNLVYAARLDPMRFVNALANAWLTQPLVVFQLFVAFQHFTIQSILLFLLMLLVGQMLTTIPFEFETIRAWYLARKYLAECDEVHIYQIHDYLGDGLYYDLDKWLVNRMTPNASLNNIATVFVSRKRGSVISNAAAFGSPFLGSYLFLRESPGLSKGIARFVELHEIAHIFSGQFSSSPFVRQHILLRIGFLGWVLIATLHAPGSYLALLALLCVFGTWQSELRRLRDIRVLADEMFADDVAVSWMSTEEAKKVTSNKYYTKVLDMLRDSKLTYEANMAVLYNDIRLTNLKRLFENRANGEIDEPFSSVRHFAISPHPLVTYSSLGIFVALAFVANEPTWQLVGWVSVSCLAMVIVFVGLAFLRVHMQPGNATFESVEKKTEV